MTPASSRWQRNAETSPLLRLPPEIRNRIYGLALTVGQIHIRYRPWRHRKAVSNASGASSPGGCGRHSCGEFYGIILDVDQDPWMACRAKASRARAPTALPDAFTPLTAVCRQLYRETASLPFALNAWSFESARIMERYLLREKRLTLLQRRAVAVLIVSDDLPSRAMERYLGGLRAVVWKDGKTFQRWELASAAELQRLVESTKQRASSRRGASLHLYE